MTPLRLKNGSGSSRLSTAPIEANKDAPIFCPLLHQTWRKFPAPSSAVAQQQEKVLNEKARIALEEVKRQRRRHREREREGERAQRTSKPLASKVSRISQRKPPPGGRSARNWGQKLNVRGSPSSTLYNGMWALRKLCVPCVCVCVCSKC